MKLTRVLTAATTALALTAGAAAAQQISDGVVKIGVLNDQSGVYADLAGPGSVEAARMAVEDFGGKVRSEEHTSELQSLMRISYAVFCLKKKNIDKHICTYQI